MRTIVGWLREAGFGERHAAAEPRRSTTPSAICWCGWTRTAARTGAGSYLRTHIGRTPRYDTSRITPRAGRAPSAHARDRARRDARPGALGPRAFSQPARAECGPKDNREASLAWYAVGDVLSRSDQPPAAVSEPGDTRFESRIQDAAIAGANRRRSARAGRAAAGREGALPEGGRPGARPQPRAAAAGQRGGALCPHRARRGRAQRHGHSRAAQAARW